MTATHKIPVMIRGSMIMLALIMITSTVAIAQENDTIQGSKEKDIRPVRSTFESALLLDNQSVMVPQKKTLEWDIQHRFGTVTNGYEDLIGIYASSNIRLGFSYTPIENLALGFGLTKNNMLWDFSAKYAIAKQARKRGMPLSITAFINLAVDSRDKENFRYGTDRMSYFYEVIIARKFNNLFSVQVAPNLSHFNAIDENMKNDHFAISFGGRVKLGSASKSSILVGVDQPLTAHSMNNPHPNLSIGYEVATSGHAFQLIIGNFAGIVNQHSNVFNANDYRDGDFLIGFNITRLWSF